MARRIVALRDDEAGWTIFRSPDSEWSVSVFATDAMVGELRALGADVVVVDGMVGA